jgi:hypothetical protein
MGSMCTAWATCAQRGQHVHSMGDMCTAWAACAQHGRHVPSMGSMSHMGGMRTAWATCAQHGQHGHSMGGRPSSRTLRRCSLLTGTSRGGLCLLTGAIQRPCTSGVQQPAQLPPLAPCSAAPAWRSLRLVWPEHRRWCCCTQEGMGRALLQLLRWRPSAPAPSGCREPSHQ